MSVIQALLLAVVQGITEFIPVSSLGNLAILEHLLGIERGPQMLYETLLHLGTAFAVFFVFWKDVVHIVVESIGMCADLIGNVNLYFQNRKGNKQYRYARIISNSYRKLAILIGVSMIPTGMLGIAARNFVARTMISPLFAGIGILITGIVLIVVDFSKAGGYKGIGEASYEHAMWMGIFQGISVFPGLSRSGLSICAGLLCGLNRKFAVKFSYLISLPAILGAVFCELPAFAADGMSVGLGFTYVLGMLIAGGVGILTIRFMLKLVNKCKLRYFAYYCFIIGLAGLFGYYLG